ncbi:ABC transporter permease, partial [candidate division KSB1 bacterium]|nr:ABC transporter permease [candidate division KSB1 bacterium]
EFRFDQFHENKQRIHQVYSALKYQDGRTQIFMGSYYPLAKRIKDEIPEVSTSLRYEEAANVLMKYGAISTTNNTVGLADPDFFKVFSFHFLKGNPETALSDLNSIVITEGVARKYFGAADPMGKILNVHGQADLMITGVLQEVPYHSSLQFDCIVPFAWQFGPAGNEPSHWGGNPLQTFILISENADRANITTRINDLYKKLNPTAKVQVDFHLHALTRLHLYSPEGGGLILLIQIASIIAFLVLIVACINFMNLSTARSATRANEVGLRKVIGANKSNLVLQFLGESILLAFITMILAVPIVGLVLPSFNSLMNKQLSLNLIFQPTVILGVLAIMLLTGIVSGSYPALFLSSFQPIQILKGTRHRRAGRSFFRKALVITQFALSIFLISSTLILYRQMDFIRHKDLGYQSKDVLCIRMIGNMVGRYETIKQELLQNPNIVSISRSVQHPANIGSSVSALDWDGKNPDASVNMNFEYVDYDYFQTLGMEIIDGRAFSKEFATDLTDGYIVNEEAVKLMGMDSPVGKRLSVFRKEGQIIGVVKNYHFQPLHQPLRPFVIGGNPGWDKNWMFIKLRSENISETTAYIKRISKKFDADDANINFHFLENALDHSYQLEHQISQFAGYFTILAILISCLGLFGLASFMAQQRTKEIGIRKVLGASVPGVVFMLSKDFTKWVVFSNLIAWPLAYFASQKMLEIYAYRTTMGFDIFILSGLAALIIALVTVSYQAIRTAQQNPVESLRYE